MYYVTSYFGDPIERMGKIFVLDNDLQIVDQFRPKDEIFRDGGFRGIDKYNDMLLVATWSTLFLLSPGSFETKRVYRFGSYLADIHGIFVDGDSCYLTSTYNDCIFKLNLLDGVFQLLWCGNCKLEDKHHYNTISKINDEIVIMACFTEKMEGREKNGYVVGLSNPFGKPVINGYANGDNLLYPHDLILGNDGWFLNDSGRGNVVKNGDLFAHVGGWVRGIVIDGDYVVVGTSPYRKGYGDNIIKTPTVFKMDREGNITASAVIKNSHLIYGIVNL